MTVSVTEIRRDVVTLTGPDTVSYLQGQLSQDVVALPVGGTAPSFVLQPQGKLEAWVRVHRVDDEEVRLDVDAGAGEDLVARLARFKLRTRTDLELAAEVPVVAVRGAEVVGGLPCGWPGMPGVDVFGLASGVLPADLPDGALAYDDEMYEGLRIACGVPAMGAEITPDVIPAELGPWIVAASVSFTKGCYTGQELVARIDSRGGNVPRHLRGLIVDALPPAPGTAVSVADRLVGTVTSSAIDAGGRSVALAFVHRSVEPLTSVAVDGARAEVHVLPLPPDVSTIST